MSCAFIRTKDISDEPTFGGKRGGLYTGGAYIRGLTLRRGGVLTGFYGTLF